MTKAIKKQTKFSKFKLLTLVFALQLFAITSTVSAALPFVQGTIKGTVTEEASGEPLIGVSIIIKGTTTGTITDFEGKYTLNAKPEDVLVFKFMGYLDQEVTVGNQATVNVAMKTDNVGLDEVVVVGYGVQKKKLNTGATVNVKGEDLEKQNTTSAMDALKGISAGVSITANNGIPGSGTKVIIRGTGTIGDASPLYVVDGVPVGNIDFLAPSDIASIDVLKDAASTAIYGSAAANGVILVTTKQGSKKMKPQVSYDFYYGWQRLAKDPKMADAKTYMEMMEEAEYNDKYYDPTLPYDPASYVKEWRDRDVPNIAAYLDGSNPGTDWLNMMYEENAPIQSHAIAISGGNENSTYNLGFNYLSQTGIIGKGANNKYERINARINSKHDVIKVNERSVFRIGENISFSNSKNPTIAAGNNYFNDLKNAITCNPLLPHNGQLVNYDGDYDANNEANLAYPYHYAINWNEGHVNPVAVMNQRGKYNENDNNNIVGNVYAEIEPINKLVLKSAYGINAAFGSSRQWQDAFHLGPLSNQALDRTTQSMYQYYQYTLTNTATYSFSLFDLHNFTLLAGQEQTKVTKDLGMTTSNDSLLTNKWEYAYISNTEPTNAAYINILGGDNAGYGKMSYFGRISYDYNETLLATFVYRADGSSRLAPGHQWGDFMSFSLGYILTNHDFMKTIPGLDYFKVRGGWGENGNDRIGDWQYASLLKRPGGSYFFGSDRSATTIGYYPALTPNPEITWETSVQSNIGFDARFLNSRLQANFDLYKKTTSDWLVDVPKPLSNGTIGATENGGAVENKGVEIVLKWSDAVGDFKYSVGGNLAYNKNEVTELEATDGVIEGNANVLRHGHAPIQMVEVGKPIGYFYGFETDGILQNQAEVDAWVIPEGADRAGEYYFANQKPGDVKFVDQNGDGVLNEDDMVMIGDPTPDFTFGFNINVEYKGFYASINANGAAGHQIMKEYTPGNKDNLTQNEIDNRWHGEGTSTKYPRLSLQNHQNYRLPSDIFLHNANFLRISNITVGYDLDKLIKKLPLQQARIYVTGQNLFTFTKYEGLDPEVGYGGGVPWGRGIDLGLYPPAKTYMIGISAKF